MEPTRLDIAIVQVAMCGVVGWLMYTLAAASGMKQISQLLKITTILICVSIGAAALWEGIVAVAEKINAFVEGINAFSDALMFWK